MPLTRAKYRSILLLQFSLLLPLSAQQTQPNTQAFSIKGLRAASVDRLGWLRSTIAQHRGSRVGRLSAEGGMEPKGRVSHSAAIPLGLPQPAFRSVQDTGFAPSATAVGDFNGDGKMDWAIAMAGDDSIWVYLGNGDGSSQLPLVIPLSGITPIGLTAVDLRHNGKLDLVVAEADSSTVGVLLGNGDGTFQPEVEHDLLVPPESILAGDFNGDGNPDVIVGNQSGLALGPVSFLAGDGTGNLGKPVTNLTDNADGVSLAMGDFNKDGKLDLVVTGATLNPLNAGPRILLGNGDGTFTSKGLLFTDLADLALIAEAAAVGDVDHDGCPDVVVFNANSTALFDKGNCDGTFALQGSYFLNTTSYPLGDSAVTGFLADVNGDGNLDLVAGGFQQFERGQIGENAGSLICVSLGDGQGHFAAQANVYRVGKSNFGLAVADLQGNGYPDLIAPSLFSSTLDILINDGKGGFGSPAGWSLQDDGGPFNTPSSQPAVLDLNGDGIPDIAVIKVPENSTSPYILSVLLGEGGGAFAMPVDSEALPGGDGPVPAASYAFGDFRGTGKPDLLMLSANQNNPFLYYAQNQGSGHFAPGSELSIPGAMGQIGIGDFNHDGKLDFVAAGASGNHPQLTLFLGKGDGTFTPQPSVSLGSDSTTSVDYVVVGDFNRDGNLDLLAHYQYQGALLEAFGNGKGGFTAPTVLFAAFPEFSAADLNHDGCPDLVSTESSTSRPGFAVYLCKSDGSFSGPQYFTPYTYFSANDNPYLPISYGADPPSWLEYNGPLVADFDGDGNPDVALFQLDEGSEVNLSFSTGNGDGTFAPHLLQIPLNETIGPQFIGDVNRDGIADFLQIDTLTSAITAALGTSSRASFGLQFRALPVSGGVGHLAILLDQPAAQARTFYLTSSNPSVNLPSQVSLPAEATSADVDFELPGNFNYGQSFLIMATQGSESHQALGYAVNQDYAAIDVTPSFIDFGNVDVGVEAPSQTVTVTNFGSAPLNGLSINSGNDCGTQLAIGASCQLQVSAEAVTPGSNTAVLTVTSDAGSRTIPLFLSGIAITTTVSVSPSTLNFTAAPGQTSPPQTVTVTNTGNLPLTFSGITQPGGYFQQTSNTCDQPVPPQGSCQIEYDFLAPQSPQSVPYGASTSITGNFPGVATISLHGSILGIGGLSLTVAPGSSNSVNLKSGQTVQETLLLSESNSAKVQLQCAVQGLTCVISSTSANGPITNDAILISFSAQDSTSSLRSLFGSTWLAWLLIPLQLFPLRRKRKQYYAVLGIFLICASSIIACGGGSGASLASSSPSAPVPAATAKGPYIATITASDGANTASQPFTIMVQ